MTKLLFVVIITAVALLYANGVISFEDTVVVLLVYIYSELLTKE